MIKHVATILALLSLSSNPGFAKAPAQGRHAMVATDEHYATQAGIDVLKRGGNAVDAAVAIGYALAVVHPCCGNIGGGGFMLIRLANGKETFLDFRERAPARARRDLFLDANGNVIKNASMNTYKAVGVPGTVMGLEYARVHYGTRSRKDLMRAAIALARKGYILRRGDARLYEAGIDVLRNSAGATRIFTHNGAPYGAGERLLEPELAATLEQIARGGTDAFYKSRIARQIVEASNANGGVLSLQDFAAYHVNEYAPLHCTYRGYRITSAPPPSSGGVTLCEMLNITGGFPLHDYGWNTARSVHVLVEAERRAYADRNTYLGDPAFVANPISQLLSPAYAARLRAQILPGRATPSTTVLPGLGPVEDTQTTHLSVVDRYGNAIAMTYTLNNYFGSGLVAGDTGFLLNNEMDDFTSKPGVPNEYRLVQGVRNGVQGGKTPLSSMTPTIVTRNGRVFMVAGSPGGSRITTITLSILQNVIDYGMNVQAAVDAPRFHHQWLPDVIQMEPFAINASDMKKLAAMGYTFKTFDPWGSGQAIVIDLKTGMLYGGSDHRRQAGEAIGY